MFLEVRQQFLLACDAISARSKRNFLAGKITLSEAQKVSSDPRVVAKQFFLRADQLHLKRHSVLERAHPQIMTPHDKMKDFVTEIDRMPEHIALSFMRGEITLVQARFAVCDRFGMKGVQELARVNTPAVPYRERKYKLGTEHSVRNPIKVRPRSRFARR